MPQIRTLAWRLLQRDLTPFVLLTGWSPFENTSANPRLQDNIQSLLAADRVIGWPPRGDAVRPHLERMPRRAADLKADAQRIRCAGGCLSLAAHVRYAYFPQP